MEKQIFDYSTQQHQVKMDLTLCCWPMRKDSNYFQIKGRTSRLSVPVPFCTLKNVCITNIISGGKGCLKLKLIDKHSLSISAFVHVSTQSVKGHGMKYDKVATTAEKCVTLINTNTVMMV